VSTAAMRVAAGQIPHRDPSFATQSASESIHYAICLIESLGYHVSNDFHPPCWFSRPLFLLVAFAVLIRLFIGASRGAMHWLAKAAGASHIVRERGVFDGAKVLEFLSRAQARGSGGLIDFRRRSKGEG
jgi:hypothetical protein